ncbi:MAG: hypothetical protein JW741_12450 [Sedimentisphaerales bacterium]|nr:hypothetical protein [Sedimentisphaerales bacterium]
MMRCDDDPTQEICRHAPILGTDVLGGIAGGQRIAEPDGGEVPQAPPQSLAAPTPGETLRRRGGHPCRPDKYTPTTVAALTQSLENYFDSTDALYFETWAAREGLHMRQVHRIADANPEFAETFARMGAVQASRLLEGSTRPADTTTNQLRYAVNPKMACLVLQAKHGYKTQQELAVEVSTDQVLPSNVEEADYRIKALTEHRNALVEMIEQANSVETAVVG